MHPMLNIAINAARRAAQIITRASLDLDLLQVSKKQHNDFVTEVDKASEAAIIETISTAYPDHAILHDQRNRQLRPHVRDRFDITGVLVLEIGRASCRERVLNRV